jgi:type I restriction enzyme S subunit
MKLFGVLDNESEPEVQGKRVLKDVLAPKSVKSDGTLPVYSCTNDRGLIHESEQWGDKLQSSKNTKTYKKLECGDILYNPSRLNVGSIAQYIGHSPICVSPLYSVYKPKDTIDIEYLGLIIKSPTMLREYQRITSTSTRNKVDRNDFLNLSVFLPPLDEQRRIVAIMDSVRDAIATKRDELSGLRALRQGALQDELSDERAQREGWEQRKLGEIVLRRKGIVPVRTESDNPGGELAPYVTAEMCRGGPPTYASLDNAVIIEAGQSMVLWHGSKAGDILCSPCEGVAASTFMAIYTANDGILLKGFVPYLLLANRTLIRTAARGTGMLNMSIAKFDALSVFLPPLDEQQRTADKLNAIQNAVVTAEAELEALETLYRGKLEELVGYVH